VDRKKWATTEKKSLPEVKTEAPSGLTVIQPPWIGPPSPAGGMSEHPDSPPFVAQAARESAPSVGEASKCRRPWEVTT
jgi:hypothetical protein